MALFTAMLVWGRCRGACQPVLACLCHFNSCTALSLGQTRPDHDVEYSSGGLTTAIMVLQEEASALQGIQAAEDAASAQDATDVSPEIVSARPVPEQQQPWHSLPTLLLH